MLVYEMSAKDALRSLRQMGLISKRQYREAKKLLRHGGTTEIQPDHPLCETFRRAFLVQLWTPNLWLH